MDELLRVSIRVALSEGEIARARLLQLSPEGFEEVGCSGGTLELAVYTDAPALAHLRECFEDVAATVFASGWEDGWRAFHHATRAGGIWIGPPWEAPPEDVPSVIIDPGLAFGTGAHATTRLCLELLSHRPRGSLLDVGCGSGVLAIAAQRLGFGPIIAVDNDPIAVEVTLANAKVNGVALDARLLDGETESLPCTDVAVANVLLAPVTAILARLEATHVVTSGYLAGEQPQVDGWNPVERLELDGWAADAFRRRA